jgi:hypothetical protein
LHDGEGDDADDAEADDEGGGTAVGEGPAAADEEAGAYLDGVRTPYEEVALGQASIPREAIHRVLTIPAKASILKCLVFRPLFTPEFGSMAS